MDKKLYRASYLEKSQNSKNWTFDSVFITAENFEEALKHIKEERPDVVIKGLSEEDSKLI